MDKKQVTKDRRKLMTVKEVQNEFLYINTPKLRAFLNENVAYIKLNGKYYYPRAEIERLLTIKESHEYQVSY